MSAPIPPAELAAVELTETDVLGWFAELVTEKHQQAAEWLALVAAAQRDWTELGRHLPEHALAGVPARACAEALEALLDRLRDELTREITGAAE